MFEKHSLNSEVLLSTYKYYILMLRNTVFELFMFHKPVDFRKWVDKSYTLRLSPDRTGTIYFKILIIPQAPPTQEGPGRQTGVKVSIRN